jgi:hypothetical protein
MPPIRCHYSDCINIEEGFCTAGSIELDVEDGCLTYEPSGEIPVEGWEEEGGYDDDFWEDEDDLIYDDEDEVWAGEDELD